MNINNRLFAYPVLSEEKNDYNQSVFNVNYEQTMQGVNSLKLSFKIEMTCQDLEKMILNGQAEYVIHLECTTTAYREVLYSVSNYIEHEFDELKNLLQKYNPSVCRQVEWKTNDGGKIKVQDIIALAWIPLSFMTNVKDTSGRSIEPVSPNKIYSAKGSCMAQFEKLMSSTQVTFETTNDYRRELSNTEVATAFAITAQLPELYDYIYEKFPDYYNATGRRYGAITAVKKMNFSSSDSDDKKKKKKNIVAPFSKRGVSTASPEGFIVPLVCGLRAIIKNENGRITWITDPKKFLESNLEKIVSDYSGILSVCEYDPQKVGKATQSYNAALAAFKMAQAGIL